MADPAILHTAYALAHAPDFVRYGSKPTRELESDLAAIPRPWTDSPVPDASPQGPFGQIITQAALYGLMMVCDDFDLLTITDGLAEEARAAVVGFEDRRDKIVGVSDEDLAALMEEHKGLTLYHEGEVAGFIRTVHDRDASLDAHVLFENLACKATAVLAVSDLLGGGSIDPADVDYLLNTGEEAVGDRYQRGGGSLSKAVGEVVGCVNATGSDIKAFCAAPVHALVMAGAMVAAGLYKYVVVLGGGSQAKMGMKFRAHLRNGVPVMEDCLASMAFVVGPDDGTGMRLRLDITGKHPIGAGSSAQAVYQALVVEPLGRAGMSMTDVDRYAVEMHNPEITEPGDSGDVPKTNYRTLAAMAVLRGEIERDQMDEFVAKRGMPGFSPTQGHIPAGVPYLGHAHAAMRSGDLDRAMIVAKGSLFLGRMTQLVDGVSFLIESSNNND